MLRGEVVSVAEPPTATNGLQNTSQVMVDKAITVRRDKIGNAMGQLEADRLTEIERCLAVFLGIAK